MDLEGDFFTREQLCQSRQEYASFYFSTKRRYQVIIGHENSLDNYQLALPYWSDIKVSNQYYLLLFKTIR